MKVYPVAGKSCWDPAKGDLLPEEGRDVVDSTFWRRRLRDDDVTLTAPVQTATVEAEGVATSPDTSAAADATPAADEAGTADNAATATDASAAQVAE